MCISTMAAAGLGNTISDVLGIGSAFYVERGCEYLGLKPPDITAVQMEMKSSRRAANYVSCSFFLDFIDNFNIFYNNFFLIFLSGSYYWYYSWLFSGYVPSIVYGS